MVVGIDGTEQPESSELDLLSLIDKIRALKYRTLKEFQLDLNSMRNRIDSKLARYHTYIESTTSSGSVVISSEGRSANLTDYPTRGSVLSSERQVVLQAFDTIVDASYNFFSGQEFVVSTLEESIRSAAENTVVHTILYDTILYYTTHIYTILYTILLIYKILYYTTHIYSST